MTFGEEVVTDSGAAAALTSPLWLPSIHTINADLAVVLPWLGATWLTIQITWRLYPLVLWAISKLRKASTK